MRGLVCGLFVLCAAVAEAQTADDRPIRRVEVEVGGGWLSGTAVGSADANLLANERERRPFTLFAADGRFAGGPSRHVRAGMALSRRLAVEGGVVLSHPDLEVSTSADVEGGPSLAIVERIDQYIFEGSLLVLIDEARLGARSVPYAAVGGGYLRQLHEGRTLIEHGHVFHAGGGLKHWLLARDSGRIRAAGLRAEVKVYLLSSGISIDDRRRPRVAASGSVFVAF